MEEPGTPTRREADRRIERIELSNRELHATNARILTALDGPEAERIDGQTYRLRKQGLVYQTQNNGEAIERIETKLGNGIRTKWPKGVPTALISASAVLIAAVPPWSDIWKSLFG